MATVGSIVVNLVAKTAAFREGMRKAGKSNSLFGGVIESTSKKILKFSAAAGLAASIGLAALIRSQFKAIDASAKMAEVLGLTIHQFESYELIAGLSGVETSKLALAFGRMQKQISDAGSGLANAKRVMSQLGLEVKKLIKLSPDEQFKAIADAFQTIPNQADKARVAMETFGRTGLSLIQVLNLGSVGINKIQKAAERLQISIGENMAQKVENANDAILLLSFTLGGLAKRLAVAVAPAVTRAANKILDFIESTKGAIPSVAKTTVRLAAMATSFAAASLSVFTITKLFTVLAVALKTTAKGQALVMSLMGPKAWGAVAAGIAAATVSAIAIDSVFSDLESDSKGAAVEVLGLTSGMRGLTTSMDEFALSTDTALSSLSGLSTEYLGGLNKAKKFGSVVEDLQTQILEFGLEGEALVRRQAFAAGFGKEETDLIAGLARQLEGLVSKRRDALAPDKSQPITTQFNKSLVSFSAGGDPKKTNKGDPEQTQFLAQIAANTRNPAAVLGP